MGSFYVDDLLASYHTVGQASKILLQLRQLLEIGGFSLRKISSNSEGVTNQLPGGFVQLKVDDGMTSTLGIQ